MIIRRISPADGPHLKTLRLAALQDAPYAFSARYEDTLTRSDADWASEADRHSYGLASSTFLAFADDAEPLGMSGCFCDREQKELAHLVAVWVKPAYRGTGVSAALIQEAIQWARSANCSAISAWVTEQNVRAIRCYEKLGFIKHEIHRPSLHTKITREVLTLKSLNKESA